jgi:hypothetical protein
VNCAEGQQFTFQGHYVSVRVGHWLDSRYFRCQIGLGTGLEERLLRREQAVNQLVGINGITAV